jgi:hypothetical protein
MFTTDITHDPFLALLASRDELEDSDLDELESKWDAGNHLAQIPRENTNNTFGAAPYELAYA